MMTGFKLDKDEKVLWEGQPRQGIIFKSSDWFFIPFSFMWFAGSIFWVILAAMSGAPIFFAFFGLPFCILGVYIFALRFFHDKHKRKNIFYAVTNKRVLISSGMQVKSISLGDWPTIQLIEKMDGTGSIKFKQEQKSANSGDASDFFGTREESSHLVGIKEPKKVYDLIKSLTKNI